MIELDQNDEYFQAEFGRFKNPPTHAHIVAMRWAMPLPTMDHRDDGFTHMLRPHVEAVYVYGRRDDNGAFIQLAEDGRHKPAHAGLDMTEYDTALRLGTHDLPVDTPELIERKKSWERAVAIRESLLAHKEGPSVEDPTVRVPSDCPKNRFTEFDLDIVFSHTDYRLRGKAVE